MKSLFFAGVLTSSILMMPQTCPAEEKKEAAAKTESEQARELVELAKKIAELEKQAEKKKTSLLKLISNQRQTVWNMPILVDDGSVNYSGITSPMGKQPTKMPVSTSELVTPNVIIQRKTKNMNH